MRDDMADLARAGVGVQHTLDAIAAHCEPEDGIRGAIDKCAKGLRKTARENRANLTLIEHAVEIEQVGADVEHAVRVRQVRLEQLDFVPVMVYFSGAGLLFVGTLLVAGLLVGVGTRYAGGCTSGHGVCGLSRLSPRSLMATLAFMGAGVGIVFVMRHLP